MRWHAGSRRDCNAKKVKAAEKSKVKAQIFDHLLYRHWNAYKEGKRSTFYCRCSEPRLIRSTAGSAVSRDPPRDLTPGDYDAPVFSLGGQDDYAFSPDGQGDLLRLESRQESSSFDQQRSVDRPGEWSGGRPSAKSRPRTSPPTIPPATSTPLYSPDGRYIAYRAQQRPGYESDRFRLMLYDRKTGEKKNLTEDFDRLGRNVYLGTRFTRRFISLRNMKAFPEFSPLDMATAVNPRLHR